MRCGVGRGLSNSGGATSALLSCLPPQTRTQTPKKSGVRDVTAVAPPDVVERWRARCRAAPQHHSARPGLQLRACDVARSPGFAPAAFDAVVDRGALDRCCCAGSIGSIGAGGVGASGNANAGAAEAPPLALQALRNYHAALRAGGALVLVSHAPPALRLALLRAAGPWDGGVDVKAVSAPPLRGGGSGGAPPAAVQRYDEERHGLANAAGWAYVYVCRK